LRHAGYSLVYLDVEDNEAAYFVRRVLRHPELKTHLKRMGTLIRVSVADLQLWRLHARKFVHLDWQ